MTKKRRPVLVTPDTQLGPLLEDAADGPVLLEKDGALYALAPLGQKAGRARLYTDEQIEKLLEDDALDDEAAAIAERFGWRASH